MSDGIMADPAGENAVADDAVSGDVVQSQGPRELDQFGQWLTDANSVDRDVDADPYQRIIEQVLSATSPDEVLTPIEAYKARDVVNQPLILNSFELNESAFDIGTPFYASMHVTNPQTGEQMVVNCGHKKMIAQLMKLGEFGQFPYQIRVIEQGRSKVTGDTMLALAKWQ